MAPPVSPAPHVLLFSRSITGDVANTFSSWNNCMSKAYCKWPVIVAIIIGALIVLSVIICAARCLCCGLECCCGCFSCCNACCPSPRRKTKYAQAPQAPYPPWGQPYGYQPQMQYGSGRQFATFDAPSGKVNEDSLPAMPSWQNAQTKHVEEETPLPAPEHEPAEEEEGIQMSEFTNGDHGQQHLAAHDEDRPMLDGRGNSYVHDGAQEVDAYAGYASHRRQPPQRHYASHDAHDNDYDNQPGRYDYEGNYGSGMNSSYQRRENNYDYDGQSTTAGPPSYHTYANPASPTASFQNRPGYSRGYSQRSYQGQQASDPYARQTNQQFSSYSPTQQRPDPSAALFYPPTHDPPSHGDTSWEPSNGVRRKPLSGGY